MDSSLRLRFILLGGLLLGGVIVAILVASFYRETSRTTTLVLPAGISDCARDDDCARTDMVGCCPCEAGGGQGAVNEHMQARLEEFIRVACRKGVPCVNVHACRDDLFPACKRGRCALVPRTGRAERHDSSGTDGPRAG
jgi:hypothetical protein